jgi:hypothetical protein
MQLTDNKSFVQVSCMFFIFMNHNYIAKNKGKYYNK